MKFQRTARNPLSLQRFAATTVMIKIHVAHSTPLWPICGFFRDEAVLKTLHTTAGGMYWIVSSERHRQGGAPIRGNIIRADEMGARTPISNAYSLS